MVKLESVNIPYKHFYVNKKLVHTDQFICMLVFEVLYNALLSYFMLLGMRIWKSPILAILCMRKHPLFSTLCNNNNNNNPPPQSSFIKIKQTNIYFIHILYNKYIGFLPISTQLLFSISVFYESNCLNQCIDWNNVRIWIKVNRDLLFDVRKCNLWNINLSMYTRSDNLYHII